MKLPLTYALLAMIATGANIGAQDLCIRAYTGPGAIAVSMLVGTGVGLVVKYLLDKRYIFAFRAANVVHEGRTPAQAYEVFQDQKEGALAGSKESRR